VDWKIVGAMAFGLVIGWYVYYVNRYRKGDVQIGDITTIIGAIGGGAILALYDRGSDFFGAYAVGLAIGFFLYFLVLIILVGVSNNFDSDWWSSGCSGRAGRPRSGRSGGTGSGRYGRRRYRRLRDGAYPCERGRSRRSRRRPDRRQQHPPFRCRSTSHSRRNSFTHA
jgi:hypothetical protein